MLCLNHCGVIIMAIPLVDMSKPGSKGGRTAVSVPSFFFRSNEERIGRLAEFLEMVEQAALRYYVDDPEAGKKYAEENEHKANMAEFEKRASDVMKEAIAAAREAKLSDKDILEMAIDSSDVQPTGGGRSENSLYLVPVGEISVDLSQFKGKVNKKAVNDLFAELSADMSAEQMEDMEDYLSGSGNREGEDEPRYTKMRRSHINGTTLTINAPMDTWEVYVDEDKFLEKLESVVDRKAVGGYTHLASYKSEAKYVTPPELYGPMMSAFSTLEAAVKKAIPKVDKNHLIVVKDLKALLSEVSDLLAELGDKPSVKTGPV